MLHILCFAAACIVVKLQIYPRLKPTDISAHSMLARMPVSAADGSHTVNYLTRPHCAWHISHLATRLLLPEHSFSQLQAHRKCRCACGDGAVMEDRAISASETTMATSCARAAGCMLHIEVVEPVETLHGVRHATD